MPTRKLSSTFPLKVATWSGGYVPGSASANLSTAPSGNPYSDKNRDRFSTWNAGAGVCDVIALNQSRADERNGSKNRIEGRVKP